MEEIDKRYLSALARKLINLIYEDQRKPRKTIDLPSETFVQHIKTGNIYESTKKASEARNVTVQNINAHLRGDRLTPKFQRVDRFGGITSKNETNGHFLSDVLTSMLDRQKYICPLTYIDLRPKIEECLPFLQKDSSGNWNFGSRGRGLPILSTNRIDNNIGHTIDNMFITTIHWNRYLNDDDLEYILKHDTEIQQLRKENIHNWHKGLDDLHLIFQTYSPSQLFQEIFPKCNKIIIS